jgi:hypothetical protein
MNPAYISFQMFLYHPFLLLSLYLYAVFIIPPQSSSISRKRSWSLLKSGIDGVLDLFEKQRKKEKN